MLKYSIVSYIPQGFPGGSVIIKKTKNNNKKHLSMQEKKVSFLVREDFTCSRPAKPMYHNY